MLIREGGLTFRRYLRKVSRPSKRKEVAKAAGVSHNTIAKVKVIEAKASDADKQKLRRGDATINKVYKAIVVYGG
jgi:hypothetical protein